MKKIPTLQAVPLAVSVLLTGAGFTQAQPPSRPANSPAGAMVVIGRSRATLKDDYSLSKLARMPTIGGAGTLAEVQCTPAAARNSAVRRTVSGSAEASFNGLPETFRALPAQVVGALPGQVVQSLSGQAVPVLPGRIVHPLPGQIVPPLPGQIVPPLPGQIIQ